jgi:hypothetical protein
VCLECQAARIFCVVAQEGVAAGVNRLPILRLASLTQDDNLKERHRRGISVV